MKLDDFLGSGRTLGEFVANPASLPGWAWVYTRERGPIALSTECRVTLADSRDLSEEDADARDVMLEREGFVCLFCRSQLEDIVANLHSRHPIPSPAQLEEAVQFYLAHDAFIVA